MNHADPHIISVQTKKELKEFINLPHSIYKRDPQWIAPLYRERLETLHPKQNPYYDHSQVRLFLAKRGSQTVGRISAQVDSEYEKFQGERVGHFGFFESENDPNISIALFQAAENFLRKHRAVRAVGPYSFSSNEESGVLIEGFDQPQMTMMPYNPPYYPDLIEAAGFQKAKDLFAWKYKVGEIPEGPENIARAVAKHPGLVVRPLNMKEFENDIVKVMEIYNSAWSHNWGFVPVGQAEARKVAKDLKLFMDPEIAFLAELNGEPIGMCLSIPNLYDLIQGLNGKLFPFGIFRLLWRIKKKKFRSGRVMALGIKPIHQKGILGSLSILLYVEVHKRGLVHGYDYGELSWTLEDNDKINAGIEFMGGKRYKVMRVFEKAL